MRKYVLAGAIVALVVLALAGSSQARQPVGVGLMDVGPEAGILTVVGAQGALVQVYDANGACVLIERVLEKQFDRLVHYVGPDKEGVLLRVLVGKQLLFSIKVDRDDDWIWE